MPNAAHSLLGAAHGLAPQRRTTVASNFGPSDYDFGNAVVLTQDLLLSGTSLTFTLQGQAANFPSHGDQNPILSAFRLEDVGIRTKRVPAPEPAALGLFGIAGLRRRKAGSPRHDRTGEGAAFTAAPFFGDILPISRS